MYPCIQVNVFNDFQTEEFLKYFLLHQNGRASNQSIIKLNPFFEESLSTRE